MLVLTALLLALQAPDALRLGMLLGLLAHKGLWEILKRRHVAPRMAPPVILKSVRVVKLGKIGVLAFLSPKNV